MGPAGAAAVCAPAADLTVRLLLAAGTCEGDIWFWEVRRARWPCWPALVASVRVALAAPMTGEWRSSSADPRLPSPPCCLQPMIRYKLLSDAGTNICSDIPQPGARRAGQPSPLPCRRLLTGRTGQRPSSSPSPGCLPPPLLPPADAVQVTGYYPTEYCVSSTDSGATIYMQGFKLKTADPSATPKWLASSNATNSTADSGTKNTTTTTTTSTGTTGTNTTRNAAAVATAGWQLLAALVMMLLAMLL
jgi:hypothetical protein